MRRGGGNSTRYLQAEVQSTGAAARLCPVVVADGIAAPPSIRAPEPSPSGRGQGEGSNVDLSLAVIGTEGDDPAG